MKKWLLAAGLGLAMVTSAQAADKIALVNMNSLFQQVAQKTGVSNTLENEFKGRASELQRMEGDLQSKMQRLQSMKPGRRTYQTGKRRDGSAPDLLPESAGV
ncbi:periplasmic molecular chaperone for outer membrane proteins [Klebsiella pneumoniae]|nr:periplasmic molecular chaperone for outer membrane proteins [Klebsiella pneumoniae]